MKEKMLREKGGAKVYVIVIVVLVVLCLAVGAFAVINMNKDKEDDKKASKKNETNTSKIEDEEKNETKDKDRDDDDDDEDSKDGVVKYSGELDMAKLSGQDELKDTVWTMSVEGNDDMISRLVIKAELGKYLKDSFDAAGGDDSGYTYKEFLEVVQKALDSEMELVGTQFATGLGVSEDDVKTTTNWEDDETLEIEVNLSKIKKSEYDVDDDESLIEYVVDSMKEEGVKMKKD